jgi:hypothetical protein
MDDIKKLDKISPTLYCTGQIYYLKKHQSTLLDSFSNMVFTEIFEAYLIKFCLISQKIPEQLNPAFLTMVSQFGSVVEVKRHCGWTGNTETSWKTIAIAQSSKK